MNIYYLSADYIGNGIDQNGQYVVLSETEQTAVDWLYGELERQGKDVQAIVAVYDVNNLDELIKASTGELKKPCAMYLYQWPIKAKEDNHDKT